MSVEPVSFTTDEGELVRFPPLPPSLQEEIAKEENPMARKRMRLAYYKRFMEGYEAYRKQGTDFSIASEETPRLSRKDIIIIVIVLLIFSITAICFWVFISFVIAAWY